MKQMVSIILMAFVILLLPLSAPVYTEDTGGNVWLMVDIIDQRNEEGWALYDVGPYWFFEKIYERGNYYAKVFHSDESTYVAYSTRAEWSQPPAVIKPGEKVTLTMKMYEIENTHKMNTSGSMTYADFAPVGHGLTTRGFDLFFNAAGVVDIALNGAAIPRVEETVTATAPIAGYNGENRIALRTGYNHGTSMGTYYIYELVPSNSVPIAEAFESGIRLKWNTQSDALGYRVFRSETQSELGISATDFFLSSTSFADVNIEPNKTYYYTVKPVLGEADPLQGINERLGASIATFTVKSNASIYKPGLFKNFMILQIDNPYMSNNGINEEIDPGRGTAPRIASMRTLVPIRAIVEAMGGKVEWDGATSKITLTARGNKVEMWLAKTDILVNGVSGKMDVAPLTFNDRTYVPIRFATENLNTKVDWINSTKEVVIIYEDLIQ